MRGVIERLWEMVFSRDVVRKLGEKEWIRKKV